MVRTKRIDRIEGLLDRQGFQATMYVCMPSAFVAAVQGGASVSTYMLPQLSALPSRGPMTLMTTVMTQSAT